MYSAPRNCPVCGEQMMITRLYCPECDTSLEGRFSFGGLGSLSEEQLAFVETFMRCEGKITRVQKAFGISYPTVRSRLDEIIRTLKHAATLDAPIPMPMPMPTAAPMPMPEPVSSPERQEILDRLAAKEISAEEAMQLLESL